MLTAESFDGRFPTVEELGKFNRLILAFFMTTGDLGYEVSSQGCDADRRTLLLWGSG